MIPEWELQWDSLTRVLFEKGQGCIAIQVNGLERAKEFAVRLLKTAEKTSFSSTILEFDSSTVSPQEIIQRIKELTIGWQSDSGVVVLISTAPVLDPKRVDFWKNMNFVRETFGAFAFHLVFMLSPDEYAVFLTEADHFADWCMLKVDLTIKNGLTERPLYIDKPSVDPRQARVALENLEQLLLRDSESGVDEKKLIGRYYLPMFFLAVDAQDFKRAEKFRRKIRDEDVPESLNRKWIEYTVDIDHKFGRFEIAREKSDQFIATVENTSNEKITAEDLRFAAALAQRSGNYKQVINFEEKLLHIQLKMYGAKHLNIAQNYSRIGAAYSDVGDHLKAAMYFNKALELFIEISGGKHPDVAMSYNNLGVAYAGLGENQKAILYYKKALAINSELFGEQHHDIAMSYNNMGTVYADLGDYCQAIWHYKKSLDILIALFGVNNISVAGCYNNLGLALNKLGQHNKAIDYFEKALTIEIDHLGERHPNIARNYNNIGSAYISLDEYKLAIDNIKKAIAILSIYGKHSNSNIATSYNNLGFALANSGNYIEAIQYFENAISIDKLFVDENSPVLAGHYSNLASAWENLGEHQKAIEYYEKSYEIFQTVYGSTHFKTRTIAQNLEISKRNLQK